jgi:hypothetical protein
MTISTARTALASEKAPSALAVNALGAINHEKKLGLATPPKGERSDSSEQRDRSRFGDNSLDVIDIKCLDAVLAVGQLNSAYGPSFGK